MFDMLSVFSERERTMTAIERWPGWIERDRRASA